MSATAERAETVAAALRSDGWCVLPDFLPAAVTHALLADCGARRAAFAAAAIGRGDARQQASDQRRDATWWLRDDGGIPGEFLRAMEILRIELNRRMYLGLFDYEAHYAHYAPGAFYRRHRDAFALVQQTREPRRILSSVFYLNACAGGELVIWRDEHELTRIAPRAGMAVFFLSADFPHEVLPAASDRYSIAGWFRGR